MIKKIIEILKETEDYGLGYANIYSTLAIRSIEYMKSFDNENKILYIIEHLEDDINKNEKYKNKYLIKCINKLNVLLKMQNAHKLNKG